MTEKNYEAFGKEFWESLKRRLKHSDWDEDDDETLEIAAKYGLCERVSYNPDIHGYLNGEHEQGEEIWWWGETSRVAV